MENLSKSTAVEWAPNGIRINSVAPVHAIILYMLLEMPIICVNS